MTQPGGVREGRGLLIALVSFVLAFGVTWQGYRPPAPKPTSAPAVEFSASRARERLRQLLGGGVPHPVGTAADAAVRKRILAILKDLGYAPQVQSGFACNPWGACADVKNILARLPGRESGPAVLLAAHYDSVGAGPGASDDGAAVSAVLEVARALKPAPPLRHSVIFLIDEGEEAGLLGAEAFLSGHPWAKEVRAAVNLEARGTSGPSLMFETGSDNAWLMRLYARAVEHPVTSSFYYLGYKQLPNDTDFTVFKKAGIVGFNFAYIGDAVHYHTPLDNFDHADLASLQHQGENALATVRALADAELENLPKGDAVFFDIFGRWTVSWPETWSLWLALVAVLMLLQVIVQLLRRNALKVGGLFWGLLAWLAMVATSALLAMGLLWVLQRVGAFPGSWIGVAHPTPAIVAFWGLAFVVVNALALAFSRRAGFWALWAGCWVCWGILALLAAALFPGASYPFLLPAAVAGLAALPVAIGRGEARWKKGFAAVPAAGAAAVLGFAAVWFMYAALGWKTLPFITLLVALILTPLAPLLGEFHGRRPAAARAILGMALLVTLVCAIGAAAVPAYSTNAPERTNIVYLGQGDTGKAQWLVYADSGRLPESLRQAAGFGAQEEKPFPWSGDAFAADAPRLDMPAPTLTIRATSANGKMRTYLARLRSARGAPVATVLFPPGSGVQSVSIRGQPIPELSARALRWRRGWQGFACLTLPPDGVEMSFSLPVGARAEATVTDESPGLPLEGLFLLKARPPTAAPSQNGDETIAARRVRITS